MKTIEINATELAQHAAGFVSTAELVTGHNVSPNATSNLARKQGFAPLTRGRKKLTKPTEQQIKILMAIRTEPLAAVGSRFGVSRQYVWSVARRWAHYPLPEASAAEMILDRPAPAEIPADQKELRSFVISFRLNANELALLRRRQSACCSSNQAAREILWESLGLLTA